MERLGIYHRNVFESRFYRTIKHSMRHTTLQQFHSSFIILVAVERISLCRASVIIRCYKTIADECHVIKIHVYRGMRVRI